MLPGVHGRVQSEGRPEFVWTATGFRAIIRPRPSSGSIANMRQRLLISLLATLGAWPESAAAQPARPCPAVVANQPYERCQLDRPLRADTANVAPTYATSLRNVGLTGTVRVRLVVDTTGRPRPGSVVVVTAAHPLLTSAVTTAVGSWTFEPGQKGGMPVAAYHDQVVRFVSSMDPDAPELEVGIISRDTTADGAPRLTVGTPDREPGAIVKLSNDELMDAQRTVLVLLAPQPLTDSLGRARVVVCLTRIRGGQEEAADEETLRLLTAPGRRAVIPRDCPRPFAGRLWDTTRPPRGWIDPYNVTPTRVDAWTSNVLVVDVEVSQAGATHEHRCTVTRASAGWRAKCVETGVRFG